MTTITIGSQSVATIAGYLAADQTTTSSTMTGTTTTTAALSAWGGLTAGQSMKNNSHNCLSSWWTAFSATRQGQEIDTTKIKARYL